MHFTWCWKVLTICFCCRWGCYRFTPPSCTIFSITSNSVVIWDAVPQFYSKNGFCHALKTTEVSLWVGRSVCLSISQSRCSFFRHLSNLNTVNCPCLTARDCCKRAYAMNLLGFLINRLNPLNLMPIKTLRKATLPSGSRVASSYFFFACI